MLGIYDSGIGGVSILQAVKTTLPDTEICYLADTAHCPIGDKTPEVVLDLVKKGVDFLFEKGCSLVVLACNTATCVAIRELQQKWLPQYYPNKKVLGIVRPISETLKDSLDSGFEKILLMATPITIRSGFYQHELAQQGMNHVLSLPCLGLAKAIEDQQDQKITKLLDTYFTSLGVELVGVEKVVLACTHYPVIKNQIKRKLLHLGIDSRVEILDQAQLVAEKLKLYLQKHTELSIPSGSTKFFTTSNPLDFQRKLSNIFAIHTDDVQEVYI
jgi:glutamate racemase